jgi:4-diphosphocytidyl-2-C-methyl-D-erythritol kinase
MAAMSEFQSYPAPAKLNLFLHVVGRRDDGYHLLQTVFRFIDFGDTLSFRLREDGAIMRVTELPGVPAEKDLVVRAARLLQETAGVTRGVDIVVEKRLPMGGGLGGGSSDAATTLLVLNRLWGVNHSREQLMALGLKLGADVPIFVFGRNAFAEGVGEQLTAVELPPAWYAVLVPPVQVPTAEIFSLPELTRNTLPVKISPFSAGQVCLEGHNDLEPVVVGRYPAVAEHLGWLKQHGDARMTGSGACVFAAFETEQQAREIFAKKPAHMQGFIARGLDHHPLYE